MPHASFLVIRGPERMPGKESGLEIISLRDYRKYFIQERRWHVRILQNERLNLLKFLI